MNKMNNDNIKKECFVGLFDILGFKDLVKEEKLHKVYSLYKSVCNDFEESVNGINTISTGFKKVPTGKEAISFHVFSDTFLVHTYSVSDRDFLVLLSVCDSLFLAGNKHNLQIRGATAVGELIVSDGIEIGQPIIDSYKDEKMQDWIGCWITNKCIERITPEALSEHLTKKSIVNYEIPMKDGEVRHEHAFNWVKPISNEIKLRKRKDKVTLKEIKEEIIIYRNKPTKWPIKRKYENTKHFLDFVLSPEFLEVYNSDQLSF